MVPGEEYWRKGEIVGLLNCQTSEEVSAGRKKPDCRGSASLLVDETAPFLILPVWGCSRPFLLFSVFFFWGNSPISWSSVGISTEAHWLPLPFLSHDAFQLAALFLSSPRGVAPHTQLYLGQSASTVAFCSPPYGGPALEEAGRRHLLTQANRACLASCLGTSV